MIDFNGNVAVEKKKELKRILEAIHKIPDDDNVNTIRQLILYLNQLLRTRPITPPTSEVMIVLQARKPKLYHATRLSVSKSSHLNMLFELRGDLALAEQRLDDFVKNLQ
jgi:hypothetical protein